MCVTHGEMAVEVGAPDFRPTIGVADFRPKVGKEQRLHAVRRSSKAVDLQDLLREYVRKAQAAQQQRKPEEPGSMTPEDLPSLIHEATANAPRMFAIVVVVDKDRSGMAIYVAGYGLNFDNHVEASSVEGDIRISAQAPEQALRYFEDDENAKAQVVWLDELAP